MKPPVILSWKSCPVGFLSFLPRALASLHLFVYSNIGHKHGAKSVYTWNSASYSVFTCREKEKCLLEQEFIKVPEQQCSSRTDRTSVRLSWSKSSGSVESLGFLAHLGTIQTKHVTGCIFPAVLLSLWICSATENMIFLPPSCAAGSIHSWLLRLREINQVVPCGPHLFGKLWKDQNLCH